MAVDRTGGEEAGDGAATALTKGQRTRARLLEAGRRVFEEHGYLDARIVDIAAEAGIAVGSFYTHFPSKEALFRDLIGEVNLSMFPPPPERLRELDPVASIELTNRHFIDFYRRNAKILAIMESVATFIPEFREIRLETRKSSVRRNEKGIARLQAQGVVDPDLDPYLTANALVAMVSNFTYAWFVLGEEFEVEDAIQHLTLLWARALGLDRHYPTPARPARRRQRRRVTAGTKEGRRPVSTAAKP